MNFQIDMSPKLLNDAPPEYKAALEEFTSFSKLDCVLYASNYYEDELTDQYMVTMEIRFPDEIPPGLAGQASKYITLLNQRLHWSHFVMHTPGFLVTSRIKNYMKLSWIDEAFLDEMIESNVESYMMASTGFMLIVHEAVTAHTAINVFDNIQLGEPPLNLGNRFPI